MSRLISGDTYTQMVIDSQNCNDGETFKAFLHALIDSIPVPTTAGLMLDDDKRFFIEDIKQCLDVTMDSDAKNFWQIDTALRDYYLDAIMKGE